MFLLVEVRKPVTKQLRPQLKGLQNKIFSSRAEHNLIRNSSSFLRLNPEPKMLRTTTQVKIVLTVSSSNISRYTIITRSIRCLQQNKFTLLTTQKKKFMTKHRIWLKNSCRSNSMKRCSTQLYRPRDYNSRTT
jgi:hypothetical protein